MPETIPARDITLKQLEETFNLQLESKPRIFSGMARQFTRDIGFGKAAFRPSESRLF